MTKHEAIQQIYGTEPTFTYDTALPQAILDNIAKEASDDFPDDTKKEYSRKVYETIRMGCVYAYDRNGHGQGLLPLTAAARLELQISNYANMIYVPTLPTEMQQW
jgi:hypothetical protein